MRNVVAALPWLCLVPLLQSCSTTPSDQLAWHVVPNAYVRHAAGTPDAYYQLARYYQGQNRHDQAIAALKKALALDESHAEAHNALGAIFAMQGRFDLALPEFQRAIEIAPAAAHLRNNLGYALYLQQRYADAVIVFEQAIALNPADKNALNNLGLTLAKLDLPEKSRDAFARAVGVPSVTAGADGDSAIQRNEGPVSTTTTDTTRSVRATPSEPLAIPKDRGIIGMPATSAATISAATIATPLPTPTAESTLELVEVHPKVFELRRKALDPEVATVAAGFTPTPAAASPIREFNLEVANGNGVPGMAKRVSRLLAASGLPVARLTNQKPFQQRETEIHFKEGYEKEAMRLSESLRTQPAVKMWAKGYARTDVRVVLGKDVATRFAVDDDGADSVHLAGYAGADD
jgi:Tfp pilus assembly protein PilF